MAAPEGMESAEPAEGSKEESSEFDAFVDDLMLALNEGDSKAAKAALKGAILACQAEGY